MALNQASVTQPSLQPQTPLSNERRGLHQSHQGVMLPTGGGGRSYKVSVGLLGDKSPLYPTVSVGACNSGSSKANLCQVWSSPSWRLVGAGWRRTDGLPESKGLCQLSYSLSVGTGQETGRFKSLLPFHCTMKPRSDLTTDTVSQCGLHLPPSFPAGCHQGAVWNLGKENVSNKSRFTQTLCLLGKQVAPSPHLSANSLGS